MASGRRGWCMEWGVVRSGWFLGVDFWWFLGVTFWGFLGVGFWAFLGVNTCG